MTKRRGRSWECLAWIRDVMIILEPSFLASSYMNGKRTSPKILSTNDHLDYMKMRLPYIATD